MEDFLKLLEEKLGSEVFTESVATDFKAQFEVALNEKLQERLQEEVEVIEEKFAADAEEFKNSLIDNVDSYLEYAAKEYLKENAIAIQDEFTVKAAKDLLESFSNIMTQNHFDVKPVEKKAAKEFQTKAIKLEEKLNKTVKDNLDLKKEILEYQKAIKFGTLTEGLSKGKKEKILSLLEGLKFTTVDDFEAKVKICIEKVNKTVTPKAKEDTVIEESFVPETKIVKEVKSEIDRYL